MSLGLEALNLDIEDANAVHITFLRVTAQQLLSNTDT